MVAWMSNLNSYEEKLFVGLGLTWKFVEVALGANEAWKSKRSIRVGRSKASSSKVSSS